MKYLHNAATTKPKPKRVSAAVGAAVRAGGMPGPGAMGVEVEVAAR